MAGFGSGMSGAASSWMEDAFKDAREDLWNERAYYERGRDRQYATEAAKLANQNNVDNYRNRYQYTMEDMRKAGLNPMLAASSGVGGVPGAPTAAGASAGFPHPSGSSGKGAGVAGYAAASSAQASLANADLASSQVKVQEAIAQKTEAEKNEIVARTPTHAVSRSVMEQQIRESVEKVKTLASQAVVNYASADQARAHAASLTEGLAQIRATVQLLQSQKKHLDQQVTANLPQIERHLKDAELLVKAPESARVGKVWQHEFSGTMAALLKVFNPLTGFIAIAK